MAHYPEGFQVQRWPEFQALARRLGIPPELVGRPNSRISIALGPDVDDPVRIEHTYRPGEREVTPVPSGVGHLSSFTFYRWPEFRAFCDRAGILWDAPTLAMTIRLPGEGELIEVVHTYRGTDTKAAAPSNRGGEKIDVSLQEANAIGEEIERMILEGSPVSLEPEVKTDPEPVVIDVGRPVETTNLHNEHYRTHQPRGAK